jgi:hypothetical protein
MQGIIEAVNNNGIRIEGKWYNSVKELQDMIVPDLKGASVEISLMPDGKLFNKITQKEKEIQVLVPEKDRMIVRQNALTQASSFLNIAFNHNIIEGKEDIALKQFEEMYFKFAERCEKWVFRN